MPLQPSVSAVHVDALLTNMSVAWMQSSTAFVAGTVFPRVPVAKKSDLYATYSMADFMRSDVQKREPGSGFARSGFHVNRDSYLCQEWGLEKAIDDQERANATSPFAPDTDAATWLTRQMMLKQEKEWIASYFSTGNLWTGSSDGADLVSGTDFTAWSNAASSPIEDMTAQLSRVESNTGFIPNTLVLGRQVWFDLKNHPDIVDRIKYTSADAVTTDVVARLVGIDKILVAAAVENRSAEGVSSGQVPQAGSPLDIPLNSPSAALAGMDYMAKDNALLVYSAPSPSMMQPTGGYTFVWSGYLGSQEGTVIERYREDQTVSDVIRVRGAWTHKIVAPILGVMFTNCSTRA